MDMQMLKTTFNVVKRFVGDNIATIFTAGIITSAAVTTVCAVIDTKNAIDKIEEYKEENEVEELAPSEVVKVAAPCYVKTAVAFGVFTAVTLGERNNRLKEVAALTTDYALLEKAKNEYRDYIREKQGDEGVEEADHRSRRAVSEEVDSENNCGMVDMYCASRELVKDGWTGKMFWTTPAAVENAIAKLQRSMNYERYGSLNDLYSLIDPEYNSVRAFSKDGWNSDIQIEITWTSASTEDRHSYMEFNYTVPPRERYMHC